MPHEQSRSWSVASSPYCLAASCRPDNDKSPRGVFIKVHKLQSLMRNLSGRVVVGSNCDVGDLGRLPCGLAVSEWNSCFVAGLNVGGIVDSVFSCLRQVDGDGLRARLFSTACEGDPVAEVFECAVFEEIIVRNETFFLGALGFDVWMLAVEVPLVCEDVVESPIVFDKGVDMISAIFVSFQCNKSSGWLSLSGK